MHHFRLPLVVTGIVFALGLVVAIAVGTWIYHSRISDRRKIERAENLGTGVGIMSCLIIAPFWLLASHRFNEERRRAKSGAEASAAVAKEPLR